MGGVVQVTALTGSIGAAISGLRLTDINDDQFSAIRTAFHKNCMLVFRDQFLSVDEHIAFAARWGEFGINKMSPQLDDYPMVLPLSNRGKSKAVTENWHYDSTFMAEPPAITTLSARDIPVGGDTMWSNQYLAYETLSPGLKAMLAGVRAEFTGTRLAKLYGLDHVPRSLHPVARTHPETGRVALYIGKPGDTVPKFENMTPTESEPLLRFLYEHSAQPDRIYRHQWRNGDLVMWDNRCTMHYAVHDYGNETRDLHRITIAGDRPR
ncbi:MAG: TauD/TfdA family dioxygenase [Rhodospirillaceae bacterium]|nr:TauD/TfdA family dioxygenase [Rhodospirillaceae bacterium]